MPKMSFFFRVALFATLCPHSLVNAQSGLSVYSAVNAASYDRMAIAEGSLFVIFGQGMGPSALTNPPTGSLPLAIAGTTVTAIYGSLRLPCPLLYVSSGQVAAVLPSGTPVGLASVTVGYNGRSASTEINVVGQSVGVFTANSTGIGAGLFTDALDASLKTSSNSAKPGDTLIAWATGVGPISTPDNAVPPSFPNVADVQVWIGNQAAQMIYAGRSGCCAALDQVAFVVPQNIAGCNVPVVITAAGKSSATTSLSISASGGECVDVGPAFPTSLLQSTTGGTPIRGALIGLGPTNLKSLARRVAGRLFCATTLGSVQVKGLIRGCFENCQGRGES